MLLVSKGKIYNIFISPEGIYHHEIFKYKGKLKRAIVWPVLVLLHQQNFNFKSKYQYQDIRLYRKK